MWPLKWKTLILPWPKKASRSKEMELLVMGNAYLLHYHNGITNRVPRSQMAIVDFYCGVLRHFCEDIDKRAQNQMAAHGHHPPPFILGVFGSCWFSSLLEDKIFTLMQVSDWTDPSLLEDSGQQPDENKIDWNIIKGSARQPYVKNVPWVLWHLVVVLGKLSDL